MSDFIKNLIWRGMIHDMTPNLESVLHKENITGYIGFDPTAASLHVGNLATIMLLKHLQLAGHKPIALVGGATGMIGDPSFKAKERKFLSQEELLYNQEGITKQLHKFLDFSSIKNSAQLLNNIEWFKDMGFLRFLREAGKHLTINYMIAKDAVKSRLEDGISFAEFSYQLIQGYDFYHLYANKGVSLQMGGADQWGNLTAGIELIRRKLGKEAHALTTPLITKANGSKFGKSEQGNIWLDPTLTSPYEFYKFWLNCADEDANRLIKVFTLLNREEIETLISLHAGAPHKRVLQKEIAKELTIRVHSERDYMLSMKTSELLFGNMRATDLEEISEEEFTIIFKSIPQVFLSAEKLQATTDVIDLLVNTGIGNMFHSKADLRRAIQENSISINKEKVIEVNQKKIYTLLKNKYLLIQRGKKQHYVIKIT